MICAPPLPAPAIGWPSGLSSARRRPPLRRPRSSPLSGVELLAALASPPATSPTQGGHAGCLTASTRTAPTKTAHRARPRRTPSSCTLIPVDDVLFFGWTSHLALLSAFLVQRETLLVEQKAFPVQQKGSLAEQKGSLVQRKTLSVEQKASPVQQKGSPVEQKGSLVQRETSLAQQEGSPAQQEVMAGGSGRAPPAGSSRGRARRRCRRWARFRLRRRGG